MKKTQIYSLINKLRILLNGGHLKKTRLLTLSRSVEIKSDRSPSDSEGDSASFSISAKSLEKGLASLDNPVLKGSYTLVLDEERLNALEEIAKEAYKSVMSANLYQASAESSVLNTIHLATDPGKVQNKRPGVYIIQNKQTGYCIIGQTKDLRKRFNQYTSRSKLPSLERTNNLNRNFYLAAQEISQDIDYSQVFQRYVVYTWVDKDKKTSRYR